jgi:23S rRNA (cytosine1962-C5)-methyltransferase
VGPRSRRLGAHGEFVPGSDEDGGGRWQFAKPVPREGWPLKWDEVASPRRPRRSAISASSRHGAGLELDARADRTGMEAPECLNLFGYTGVGTLAMAAKGAKMTSMSTPRRNRSRQGKANAALSGMADKPIRWMIDDADQVRRARGAARAAL